MRALTLFEGRSAAPMRALTLLEKGVLRACAR
jgi:hypothetical protein